MAAVSSFSLPASYHFKDDAATVARHRDSIIDTLLNSPDIIIYWGKQRSRSMVERQMERAWRNVCLVQDGEDGTERLAGFSRVIADGVGFGYFTDFFVLPEHGGKGLAKALAVETVENSAPGGSSDWKWVLFTLSAHKLYSTAVNFARPDPTGWAMLRWPSPSLQPTPLRPLPPSYRLDASKSTSLARLDEVFAALVENPAVYWGKARTKEVLRGQIENATSCVCVLKEENGVEKLAGWCRVVGDGEEFAYLCDVVILPEHGKIGLSKALVQAVIENTGGSGASNGWKWFLWTGDAHKLYSSVAGFEQLPVDGRVMERMPKDGGPASGN